MKINSFSGGETPPPHPMIYDQVPCECGYVPTKNSDKFERKYKFIKVRDEESYIMGWQCKTCKGVALLRAERLKKEVVT